MNIYKTFITIQFLVFGSLLVMAQPASVEVSGPSSVGAGGSNLYSAVFRNSSGQVVPPPGLYTEGFDWQITGSYYLVSYSAYSCEVVWTGAGTYNITYVAHALNDVDYTDDLTVTVNSAPPVATAATGITGSSFTANWNVFSGATGYRLDVATDNNFTSFVPGYNNLFVGATSQAVTGLTNGATYYYRVRGVGGFGTSANSNTISVQTGIPAAAATSVEVSGTTSVLSGETYTYTTTFRNTAGQVVPAPGLYTDAYDWIASGNYVLVSSGAYTCQIRWTEAGAHTITYSAQSLDNVSLSDDLQVTVTFAAPVANAASAIGGNSFAANWSNVSGASGYRLDVATNDSFTSFVPGYNNLTVTSTSQSVAGLTPGTTYYYRVRAVNAYGTSASSNPVSAQTTPAAPVATMVSGIATGAFVAHWNVVSGATDYLLEVSTVSSFATLFTSTYVFGTNQGLSGLAAGTDYYYRVKARNASGASDYSNIIHTATTPLPPVATTATAITSTSFTANWSSVSSAGYKLDVCTDAGFTNFVAGYNSLAVSSTNHTVTGLTPGMTYYYRVRAVSFSGESANSNINMVQTISSAPTAIAASTLTTNSFTAHWNAVSGASNYILEISNSTSFSTLTASYDITATNQIVSGLSPNIIYFYRVKARNTSGDSGFSNTIQTATLLPAPVATNATSITASSFMANWNNNNASGYQLDVSADINFSSFVTGYNNLNVSTTNHGITNLGVKSKFYYRVRALNVLGYPSENSNTILVGELVAYNYIRAIDVTVPGKTTLPQVEAAAADQRMTRFDFFDGLGKLNQSVSVQSSPAQHDVIQPVSYDAFGREDKKYLPYADGSSGWFKADALKDPSTTETDAQAIYRTGKQFAFYQTGGAVASDLFPYAETRFEPSALNRTVEKGAPGQTWQPDAADAYASTDRTMKMAYELNVDNEVLLWTLLTPSATYPFGLVHAGTTASPVYYPKNTLFKHKAKDEQFNESITFTDKDGKTVLRQVQSGPGQYASTYYVYDDFDNLVYVIPPEATRLITSSPSGYMDKTDPEKEAFLKRWAFRYRFDSRNRMTLKQIPGADSVRVVYDRRDRVVLTQDGNLRSSNKWHFTKYDALNRPVMTGIYTHSNALTQNQMAALISTTALFETYNGDTNGHGYSNTVFAAPNFVPANQEILTVTYYDGYLFKTLLNNTEFDYKNNELPATSQHQGQDPAAFAGGQGKLTGTKVKVLDQAGTWLWTVNYYDDRYRIIQTTASNYKTGSAAGFDRITNVYDFTGKVMRSKIFHAVAGHADRKIIQRFSYDHMGRLLNTWHQIEGSPEVLLASNEYNEIGQLTRKQLHQISGGNFLQAVDYRYTIRGWLKKINDPLAPANDLFSMELHYDDPTTNGGSAQFNGNVSEVAWKSAGLDRQSYGYHYDPMSRITQGLYYNSANAMANGRYDEKIGDPLQARPAYDLNGNILNLLRNGKNGSATYGVMDDLTYSYTDSGNKLTAVTDNQPDNLYETGFREAVEGATDYSYDANGNIIADNNKGITAIAYNFLNLPSKVEKSATDYVTYTYDASGKKLAQQVFGAAPKTTDYIGSMVLENGILQFMQHSEGRVIPDAGGWEYQYHLKDHLGNVRLTLTSKEQTDATTATLEPANTSTEESQYVRYANTRRVRAALFDHTNGTGDGYAMRLNGSSNEKFGLARSLSVMPGDVVKMEVYAKYVDGNPANWNQALSGLMAAVANNTGGIVTDGVNYTTSTSSFNYAGILNTSGSTGQGPKAYLNWLLFDRNFNFKTGGYIKMSDAARETGQDVAHERLAPNDLLITEPGYVYIYLSNEDENPVDVFFDDFSVEQVKSSVVQVDDYYPFGLSFNSFSRENGTPNKFLFSGKELEDELGLNVYDFGWRDYDPAIARWNAIDQLAENYHKLSPYAFVNNNPVSNREIDGRYFEERSSKRKAARIEKRATRAAGKLDRKADRLERRGKSAGDLRQRSAELRQSAQDVRDMRADEKFEYRYRGLNGKDAKRSNVTGPATLPTAEAHVVITMYTESTMGSKLHEGRHGGQVARGDYNVATKEGYGVTEEISSYKAQYSWKGTLTYEDVARTRTAPEILQHVQGLFRTTINNINSINADMVNNIGEWVTDGHEKVLRQLYPPKDEHGNLLITLDRWNAN